MATTIRIKRSGVTPSPTILASGELAYSWESSTGGKLYLGWGDETVEGQAPNISVIGGKYFTDKLGHTPGLLTANSAIITDQNNKIDILNVSNITLSGNTISSTNINGNIIIDPNGSGDIDASGARIINLAEPTANTDAVTKSYVDTEISNLNATSFLDIQGDTGVGNILLASEIFTISGGTGISTEVANNTVTITLDDTGVNANTYGSSFSIPIISVNAQGQITAVTEAVIATDLSIAGDSGTDTISLLNDTLTLTGGTGISTDVTANTVTFSLDDTTVAAGQYGSETATTTFTVDSQGRLTAAETVTIAIPSTQVTDFTEAVQDVVGGYVVGGQSITVTYDDSANNSLTFSANIATVNSIGVASFGAYADEENTVRQFEVSNGDVKIINIDVGTY